MRDTLDWLPVSLMTLTSDAVVTGWNRSAERVFGLVADEIVGQPPPLGADDLRTLQSVVQTVEANGEEQGITVEWGPAGVPVHCALGRSPDREIVAVLTPWGGGEHGSTDQARAGKCGGTATSELRERDRRVDVLEQRNVRRTEELAAANRELASFAYSVSHDLRQPLRAIDGFSQALLEDYSDRLDGEAQDFLQRIRRASQRMGELIDGLLALSRITRGDLHQQQVDLSALADAVAADLRRLDPDRHVTVTIEPNMRVWGDPRLMRVILDNLIGNAWKYTARREDARIDVRAVTRDGEAVYAVADNGVGFDMRYADKLFGPFQRLHSTGEFEGNGIGLATVQRIVHRHGGKVWGEGVVDQGAVFSFTLPGRTE